MKTLVRVAVAILAIISLPAWSAQWELAEVAGEARNRMFYVDMDSVLPHPNGKKFWVKNILNVKDKRESNENSYQTLYVVNCKTRQFSPLKIHVYSGWHLDGDIVSSVTAPIEMEDIVPDSAIAGVSKYVCDPAIRKRRVAFLRDNWLTVFDCENLPDQFACKLENFPKTASQSPQKKRPRLDSNSSGTPRHSAEELKAHSQ